MKENKANIGLFLIFFMFVMICFTRSCSSQVGLTKFQMYFEKPVYVISETAQKGCEHIWQGQGKAKLKLKIDEEMIFRVYLQSDTLNYTSHVFHSTENKREFLRYENGIFIRDQKK